MKDSTIYLLYNTKASDVKVESRPKTEPNRERKPLWEYVNEDEFTIKYGDDDNRLSTDISIFSKTKLRGRPKTADAIDNSGGGLEGVFVRRANSLSKIEDLILLRRMPLIKPLLSETEIARLQKFQDVCKEKALELKMKLGGFSETEVAGQQRTLGSDEKVTDLLRKYPDGIVKDPSKQLVHSESHIKSHSALDSKTDGAKFGSAKEIQDKDVLKFPKFAGDKLLQEQKPGKKKIKSLSESNKNKQKSSVTDKEKVKQSNINKKEIKTKAKGDKTAPSKQNKVSNQYEATQKRNNKISKSVDHKAFSDKETKSKETGSKAKSRKKSTLETSVKGDKSKGSLKDNKSKPITQKDKPVKTLKDSAKSNESFKDEESKSRKKLKGGEDLKENVTRDRAKSVENLDDKKGLKYKAGENTGNKSERSDENRSEQSGKMGTQRSSAKSLSKGRRDETYGSGVKEQRIKSPGGKVKSSSNDESSEKTKRAKTPVTDKSDKNLAVLSRDNQKSKKSASERSTKGSETEEGRSRNKSHSSKRRTSAATKTTDKSSPGTEMQSQSKDKSGKTKKESKDSRRKSKFSSIMQNMIRYVLSNKMFLKMGWTLLPSDHTMSRVVTFKTRAANQDIYCFREMNAEEIKFYPEGQLAVKIKPEGIGGVFYPSGFPAMVITKGMAGARLTLFSDCKNDPLDKESFISKVIGIFDCFGNGVVYNTQGKKILNFNQLEGIFHSRENSVPYRWRWHAYETLKKQCAKELLRSAVAEEPQVTFRKAKGSVKGGMPSERKSTIGSRKLSPEKKSEAEKAYENLLAELPRPVESKPRPKRSARFAPFKPIIHKINDEMTLRINGQGDVTVHFSPNKFKLRIDLGVVVDPENVEKIEDLRSDLLSENVTCVFDALKTLSPSLQKLNEQIKSQRG